MLFAAQAKTNDSLMMLLALLIRGVNFRRQANQCQIWGKCSYSSYPQTIFVF